MLEPLKAPHPHADAPAPESEACLEVDDLRLTIRRSAKRRTMQITVERSGELVLSAPPEVGIDRLRDFVSEKRFWIYTKLAETARQEAYELLVQHAREVGANAIFFKRKAAYEIMEGITEVLAYGTAVVVEPVQSRRPDFQPVEFINGSELDKGDPKVPAVLINKRMAQRLFPGSSALGKSIYIYDGQPTQVIGVLDNLPSPNPSSRATSAMRPISDSVKPG